MKKLFSLILALLATTSLWAYDFQIDDFNFRVINKENLTLEVYAKDKYIKEANIPETVTYNNTTYTVTQIRKEGFANCSNLTSITIPNSILYIGNLSFSNCPSLQIVKWYVEGGHLTGEKDDEGDDDGNGIYIPGSVLIGGVKLPAKDSTTQENITDIFYGSRAKVSSFIFGDSVKYIPDSLCINMTNLMSIDIPNQVENIGHYAFAGCSLLRTVVLGDSIETIGRGAFFECNSLRKISIPNSVIQIGESAFGNCYYLASLNIGSGVTNIGDSTFSNCSTIEEIYCHSITPPTITENTFDNYDAEFYVPCDSKEAYEEHPVFGKFEKIKGIEGCGEYVTTHIHATICQGEVYEFGGGIYDATGTYISTIDLIPTYLYLTVLPRIIDTITIDTCDSYEWHGKVYTVSGDYTYHRDIEDSAEYCYTEILHLTINKSTYEDVVVEAYDSYEWHGLVYTESGTYIYEEPCYQEILHLTIIDTPTPPSEPQDTTIYYYLMEQFVICEGEAFAWDRNGTTYTQPGTYAYEEIVVEDDYIYHYIYTLELQVLPSSIDTIVVEAYDSYEWHGKVYTESGVYVYSDPYNPCVIEELHLTIIDTPTPPSEPQDTTIYYPMEQVVICEGEAFTWYRNGNTYTQSGIYAYEEIVVEDDYIYHYIYTLELQVLPSSIDTIVVAYDSYEWHGVVYTESGVYTYRDSYNPCVIEELHLTIIPSEDNQGEVIVEPSTNSVTITWEKEDDADTYIIVIKQGDKVVCTLIFDAEGNLVSINYLPGREGNNHGIQYAVQMGESFQYTITGLASSTTYTYTVTAIDDSDNTINTYSGEFTTHNATSVENTHSQSPMTTVHKFLRDGQLLIIREGKMYNVLGASVHSPLENK